jgi:hypothetical protein
MKDDVRHGLRIARVEVVNRWRGGSRSEYIVAGLSLLVLLVVWFPYALSLGRSVASGAVPSSQGLNTFRIAVNLPFIILPFVIMSFGRLRLVDNQDLLSTTVSVGSVVIGETTLGLVRLFAVYAGSIFFFALGFGLGIGSPMVALVVFLFSTLLLALSVTFGYTVVVIRLVLRERVPNRPRLLNRIGKAVISFSFVAAFFLVPILFLYLPVKSPITIYADAFFLGTPLGSPDFGTLVAVVGVVAGIPLSVFASTRLAPLVLPFESGDDESVVEKPSQDTFENKDAENSLEALSTRTAGRNPARYIFVCSHNLPRTARIHSPLACDGVSGVSYHRRRRRSCWYIPHRHVRAKPSRRRG